MLERLSIQDFALIRQLDLHTEMGLTVISGETGAGKSIFLGALSYLSGLRANREVVRKGSSRALVEAEFSEASGLLDSELLASLALSEEELSDKRLILSREVDKNGHSTSRINGRMVSLSLLREVAAPLLAIHAQHEQLRLYDPQEQARVLDRYLGERVAPVLERWKNLRRFRLEGMKELKDLGMNPEERKRQTELLRYQLEEIHSADFKPGEVEALSERFRLLSAAERVQEEVLEAAALLNSEEEGQPAVRHLLGKAAGTLKQSAAASRRLAEIQVRLQSMAEETGFLAGELRDLGSSLMEKRQESEAVNARLDVWDKLRAKYGESEEEIAEFRVKAEKRLADLEAGESRFINLRGELLEKEKEAESCAAELTELRRKASEELSKKISLKLRELNMPEVRFTIDIQPVLRGTPAYWSENGRDRISFLIAANRGEDLLPLAKIASGGESSRVLLAIKSILADSEGIPVLIFDEIDSGISGVSAGKVGLSLKELAHGRQVFAVSHMAQIVSLADHHLYVHKEMCGERTETRLDVLDEAERRHELARLLTGRKDDQQALELAANLRSEARELDV